MLLYYITDRMQLAADEPGRRRRLLEKIAEAVKAGVDYIQLRERDLSARELASAAAEGVTRVRGTKTKLLINSRVDVAIAAGADGVHLRSDDIAASEARAIWARSTGRVDCVIGVSCHSIDDVLSAEGHGADFVVFGPVFGKVGSKEPPTGLDGLGAVVRQALKMPVIALGGVTLENAHRCVEAGAAGVAGIRLFQESDVGELVKRLR